MPQEMKTPQLSDIKDYCRACGLVPPLLINQIARKVQLFMDGDESNLPDYQKLLHILAETKRFPSYHKYNEGIKMNYQDFVGVHQERMYQMVMLFKDELEELGIDTRVLLFLCKYHDAPEGVSEFGDIPTPVKENFDDSINSIHVLYERCIIKSISENVLNGEIEGFTAEEIHDCLALCVEKKEVIGQLLSYIDKFDAMMVCFHEVMSGNKNFFVKKLKYYRDFFRNVHSGKKLNLLQDIIKQTPEGSHLNLLFSPHTSAQMDAAKKEGKSKAPYGSEDLHQSYGVPAYLLWKISTRNITQAHVGNQSMDGTQILLEMR